MKANEVQLIDLLIYQPGQNLSELVRSSQLPQTTVYRALGNLCREKLLIKQKDNYYLGPVLLRWINSNILDRDKRYVEVIHPYLVELAKDTGESVHLVQRHGLEAFYIDKVEGSGPIALKSKVGNKLQLYCTGAGRALLTLFAPEELQLYWCKVERAANTPKTQTDVQILEQEITNFRHQGFAVEVEQDQATVQCLGAPIDLGHIQLAISITTTILCDSKDFLELAKLLQEMVRKVKTELNY